MKLLLIAALAISPMLARDNGDAKRLDQAGVVFSEIMATPDKGILRIFWITPAASSSFLD